MKRLREIYTYYGDLIIDFAIMIGVICAVSMITGYWFHGDLWFFFYHSLGE